MSGAHQEREYYRPAMSTLASSAPRARRPWLVGPVFDATCLAWAWVPYYLFVVLVLGLDGSWSIGGRDGNGTEPGLGLATLLALGASYVHRHYTFLLVYGDRETFAQRVRAYTVIPALLFVALALAIELPGPYLELGSLKLRPWNVVLVITGAWNVWHTLMQRHGIARIYAAKAGGGLQQRAHARRDLALLWSCVALTAVVTPMFRAETFAGIANARRVLDVAEPILGGWPGQLLLALVLAVTLVCATRWFIHERQAELERGARVPRLNFLLSTAALLLVLVVHGPIVGYLCFGVAHAVEYVFFFHVFGHKKFARRPREQTSLAQRLLARPTLFGPMLALLLVAVFFALADYRKSEPYLVYYTATSLLHFLYDGWIWKVRKPEVSKPLGLS